LKHWRELADRKLRGYKWNDGILLKEFAEDEVFDAREVIVLPKTRKEVVMKVAHTSCGHLSANKVVKIIKQRFTWPTCSADVTKFCKSCETCQKNTKAGV